MSGELGRQLEKLVSDFNAIAVRLSLIVPTYKGNYTETVTARDLRLPLAQPARPIVQVNEVATADHEPRPRARSIPCSP